MYPHPDAQTLQAKASSPPLPLSVYLLRRRALNTTPSGTTAQFLLYQRYSWRRSANAATMCPTLAALMGVTGVSLGCYYGTCTGWGTSITTDVYCTDFDATIDYSSGERYDTVTLTLGTSRSVGFYSSAWLALAYVSGQGSWSVMNLLNAYIRPDGVINTSPVTTTLPVIYKTVNVQQVHVIQMSDADPTDTLKCRWAVGGPTSGTPASAGAVTSNVVQHIDECGSAGVCQSPSAAIPGANLIGSNCTLVFTLSSTQVGQYFAVALQIEDFYTSSSTTPMSSVPIQFLFYAVSAPGACSVRPSIIGVRPNRACIGTPVGSPLTETVVAQAGCVSAPVVRFTTASPKGLTKSAVVYSAGTYILTLSWTPTAQQYGPQGFCAAAVDSLSQQSDQWCITFLVGFSAPNLQTPLLVQGSASPIGTVFANQTIFSIQSQNGVPVNRPGHNGTYIAFHDINLNGTVVLDYDCGWSPNVIYSGSTILIYAPFAWVPGHRYYITFDSGASSGNDFCHAESAPITNPAFWQFDIWNPALSSTTTTTTPPPTTVTVTTRVPLTTTPVPNVTTTGIIITTAATTAALITTTTATTTLSTTSATTASTTSTIPEPSVMTPRDFQEACKQPVIIMTSVTMAGMLPIHAVGMFAIFTKLNKMFNPQHLKAAQRQRLRR